MIFFYIPDLIIMKFKSYFSDVGSPRAAVGRKILYAILSAAVYFTAPAAANDTNAVIGAGGLRFIKTNELKMEREDLYLSIDAVRVKYIFRNLADYDITTTVAFPMPDIDMEEIYGWPHEFHLSGREGDVVDFHVRVNGQDVEPSIDVHAINPDGRDVTETLHRFKIPVTEKNKSLDVYDAIGDLRPNERAVLLAEHAVYEDGDIARWKATSVYHWQQTFPAGAAITVEHWYKPIVGGSAIRASDFSGSHPEGPYNAGPWCPDRSFLKAMSMLAPIDEYNFRGDWIEYILKTGANWAGPISHFRLELDKGKAALLSTCPVPGLTLNKQGNSFVAEADNFTPTTDLKILFLNKQ